MEQYSRWVFPCKSRTRETEVGEDNAKAKQHRWITLQQGPSRRSPTKRWSCLSLKAHHHSQTTETRKIALFVNSFEQSSISGIMHLTVTDFLYKSTHIWVENPTTDVISHSIAHTPCSKKPLHFLCLPSLKGAINNHCQLNLIQLKLSFLFNSETGMCDCSRFAGSCVLQTNMKVKVNFGVVLEKPISYPRHFSCFAFTLIHSALQSHSENDRDYTNFGFFQLLQSQLTQFIPLLGF